MAKQVCCKLKCENCPLNKTDYICDFVRTCEAKGEGTNVYAVLDWFLTSDDYELDNLKEEIEILKDNE